MSGLGKILQSWLFIEPDHYNYKTSIKNCHGNWVLSTKNDIKPATEKARKGVTLARNPSLSPVTKILGTRASNLVYILSILSNSYSWVWISHIVWFQTLWLSKDRKVFPLFQWVPNSDPISYITRCVNDKMCNKYCHRLANTLGLLGSDQM